MAHFSSPLIEPQEVVNRLHDESCVILDATFTLPAQNRNPQAEFVKAHIPGSFFFDIDVVAAVESKLPHMLPSVEDFETAVSALGIGNETQIIVYDSNQFMASARVWWMFRIFGHENIRVMNGGLTHWIAQGYPLNSEITTPKAHAFSARFNPELVKSFSAMEKISSDASATILDARPLGRFLGQDPEPRPGLRSGHIPGSHSLFFQRLLDPQSRRFLSEDALHAVFKEIHVEPGESLVATCGSGVTAAIIALALAELGHPNTPIYDGSWSEWGLPGPHVVATGTSFSTSSE
jgi:thiosulfate/3-mercaptopyruvate sulfurtransferase